MFVSGYARKCNTIKQNDLKKKIYIKKVNKKTKQTKVLVIFNDSDVFMFLMCYPPQRLPGY